MRTQNLEGLELHGVAIGAWAVERSDTEWGLAGRLVCTPIAVAYAQPDMIKILDDLAFQQDVRLNNISEVVGAFARLTDVLETVIGRQQDDGEAYR